MTYPMDETTARAFVVALQQAAEREGHGCMLTHTVANGERLSVTYNPPMRKGAPDLEHVSRAQFCYEWEIDGENVNEIDVLALLTGQPKRVVPSGEELFAQIAERRRNR